MQGKFILTKDLEAETLDWGKRTWLSLPSLTGAKTLVVVEVDLQPGFGHNFHIHPNQEEHVYVLKGPIEQWLETEKQILSAGDSTFIPANTVHATFNVSDQPVKVLAILGPAIGDEGYELIEVYDQEPWVSLR
jgi:quercetin dioxygenase-like cupin family protein